MTRTERKLAKALQAYNRQRRYVAQASVVGLDPNEMLSADLRDQVLRGNFNVRSWGFSLKDAP